MINFDEYIEDVKSQLDENATDFHKNNYVTYTYSNELIEDYDLMWNVIHKKSGVSYKKYKIVLQKYL
jgi:hypothetical protein